MWEGKPLSPNALADDEYLASVAKDLGANEWVAGLDSSKATDLSALVVFPDGKAPRAPGLTKKDLNRALSRLSETIGKAIARMVVAPLEARIRELEQREWVGTWASGKSFAKNSIISHDGSAWLAVRQYPEGKPGTPDSGWKLIVKRGRDGKDATR